MTLRPLSDAQDGRLELLARQEPGARVVGWDDRGHGPLVRRPGRRLVVVRPDGRLVARTARSVVVT